MGAVDDWSGAVMLPSVYQSLKSKARRDTFVFVAFAGEEGGLLGLTCIHQATFGGRAEAHLCNG